MLFRRVTLFWPAFEVTTKRRSEGDPADPPELSHGLNESIQCSSVIFNVSFRFYRVKNEKGRTFPVVQPETGLVYPSEP
ncbi:hypothetical protein SKAU_G00313840 [Synaphobranchus kaupii]|uniref:Uncharacterized protein n=1 Tax=Synaphobranchus kaupii TaxID=118154 RepID=A0A9Q1ES68_SYNKA|nr:hypothetical protein SKAU_G00313840 [Synaphobranchus kaupii]